MNKTYIQYITKEGERWDTISFKMYGTTNEIEKIIKANPQIPILDKLKSGIILEIPIMEENNLKPDKNLLPPWKKDL